MIRFGSKLIMAIICFTILSFGAMNNVPAAGSREPLSTAMEATGAKVEEYSINSWVRLSNAQLNNDQLENMVQQVMSRLGVSPQNYQLIHQQDSKHRIVQAEVISKNFHALAIAQVISGGTSTSEPESYLVVNIEEKAEGNISIRQMQEKISNIINDFGSSPQISTCLIGGLDGKLRDGEWHGLLCNAFMAIDAMTIDQLKAENFASYTGFTPEIPGGLQVDGKRINFNMAMRYSPYDNRTYITVASPIITREY